MVVVGVSLCHILRSDPRPVNEKLEDKRNFLDHAFRELLQLRQHPSEEGSPTS